MKHVVVDLEWCNVPKGLKKIEYRYKCETIQIGAVLLDENYNIIDKFMTYVKPQYGVIKKFITDLTGITEEDVADAPNMAEALEMFTNWIPEDATMVQWSESDKTQIFHEINGKNLDISGVEKLSGDWIDCQKLFSQVIDNERKQYNLVEAMNLSNIIYNDRIHDGLVDAQNTALLFKKIKTEKCFTFNEYYYNLEKDEKEDFGYNPFASWFNTQTMTA